MADTRKDKRAPVSLKVRFKSATVDEFIEHYSKDVSRGGIYIKSSQPMAVGTLLKFQFQLKDESALIRGVGRVVWTRAEVDATADNPAGMGIKFIKMDNESRSMVERIVDSNAPDPGSYVSGRLNATSAEPTSSAPPPNAGGGSFFPDLPPAELPPPEDRTAVRHATQFLANALTEGGTDEEATKEAQARAEEAKLRQAEVEAERKREAEAARQSEEEALADVAAAAQDAGERGSLPSMIIDPSLEPRAGRPSEAARETDITPLPAHVFGSPNADDAAEPDTEPPPPPVEEQAPLKLPTTPAPANTDPPRSNLLPILAIAAVLAIAAWVALRGGPEETAVEQPVAEPVAREPAKIEPAKIEPAKAPEPEPPKEEVAPTEPTPAAQAPEPAADPAPEPAPTAVQKLAVEVLTTPKGAEVWFAGEKRGEGPLSLELPLGVESVVSARAPGFQELSANFTPQAGKRAVIKLRLKPTPWVVHVETTPPGAAINVGGVKGVTPTDLTLDRAPSQELSVTAKLDGYERALTRIPPSAFSEGEGAMRTQLNLVLKAKLPEDTSKEAAAPGPVEAPKKAPSAKKRAAPAEPSGEAKPSEAAPDAPRAEPAQLEEAPKPEEKPAEPKPAEPKPAEPLPTNPFGN
jgi:uncharacterized protein (TIGR02266 family)